MGTLIVFPLTVGIPIEVFKKNLFKINLDVTNQFVMLFLDVRFDLLSPFLELSSEFITTNSFFCLCVNLVRFFFFFFFFFFFVFAWVLFLEELRRDDSLPQSRRLSHAWDSTYLLQVNVLLVLLSIHVRLLMQFVFGPVTLSHGILHLRFHLLRYDRPWLICKYIYRQELWWSPSLL